MAHPLLQKRNRLQISMSTQCPCVLKNTKETLGNSLRFSHLRWEATIKATFLATWYRCFQLFTTLNYEVGTRSIRIFEPIRRGHHFWGGVSFHTLHCLPHGSCFDWSTVESHFRVLDPLRRHHMLFASCLYAFSLSLSP